MDKRWLVVAKIITRANHEQRKFYNPANRTGFIRNFLDRVVEESGTEYLTIQRKVEEGEITELDNLDGVFDYPIARQEIGARAVYYEINSLIESELRQSAIQAWVESKKGRGPKTLATLDPGKPFPETIRSLKTIYDVSFKDIVELIEGKYHIKISDLEGAEILSEIRETVNAFKHRNGFLDTRKQLLEGKLGARYQADVDKAYEALDKAYTFITALWKATGREPLPKKFDPNDWDEGFKDIA